MKNYILEACVDSVASAKNAEAGGANRLELCANLIIGGTTPSPQLFKAVRKACGIKIHVLIRPRFGDFCYSKEEFEIIKEEVKMFRELGADGVVIGVLKPDGTLDKECMQELIACAGDLSITLHRAFDVCVDPYKTLEEAKELGVHTILTSGQQDHCLNGHALIADLVKRSQGDIDILVGSGVSAKVIEQMRSLTGATSYHMSGKIVKASQMIYRKEDVHMGLSSMSEYDIWETSMRNILEAVQVLKQID